MIVRSLARTASRNAGQEYGGGILCSGAGTMVRAFFVALGISLSLLGAESLFVEKAVLKETTNVV